MKAVLLAGGEGTRLRPLTLHTPKPAVPVVDRPFLAHQIEMLVRAGIREIVFSVAYQPEKIRDAFGEGEAYGVRIHYAVEASPLGTGGAVKNAEPHLDGTTVVMNGDVLTDCSLSEVISGHIESGARATLVLTPVSNPSAYGLVETDPSGRVTRFLEKPSASEITTNTINAGIYVLEKSSLALIDPGVPRSIERTFFPALIERGDLVRAHVHRGYWIDIGTPEKYHEVHRDILHRRFAVCLDGEARSGGFIHPSARVHVGAVLEPPFYIGPGCLVEESASVGPDAVLVREATVRARARVEDSVLWRGCEAGEASRITGALLGGGVRIARYASLGRGAVLGEEAFLPEYSTTALGAP